MNWIKKLYTRIFPASKYQLKFQTEMLLKSLRNMERNNNKLLTEYMEQISNS